MQIIPNVYQLKVGFSNAYLIVEDGLTLIDAGVKASYEPIIKYIRSIGEDPADLRSILITHADIDHVGAANLLTALSGAAVCASQLAADALALGQSSRQVRAGFLSGAFTWFERRDGTMRIDVGKILSPGDELPLLGGLQVLETPGHTPCHISFYAPQHNILFCGDSITSHGGRPTVNRRRMFNWDQGKMIASMQMQAELKPQIICAGHGDVIFDAAGKFTE